MAGTTTTWRLVAMLLTPLIACSAGGGGAPAAMVTAAGRPGPASSAGRAEPGSTGAGGAGSGGAPAADGGRSGAGVGARVDPGGAAGAAGRAGAAGSAAIAIAGTGGSGSASGEPVCGSADEDATVSLSCPSGMIVDQVVFASYGNPSGACGSFAAGSCEAGDAADVVRELCAGRASCTIPAGNGSFGDPCRGTAKRLAIEARCVNGTPSVAQKPFKGVANSPCDARTALGVSWYYNWEQAEKEPCGDGRGGEFVPMIWGHPGAEQRAESIRSALTSFVDKHFGYVLGFNEPDNSTQSNIPVMTAIGLWPAFDDAAIKIASPATAAGGSGQAWFNQFMSKLEADPSLRADVLAIHWYGWNAGSCDAQASQLENYVRWAEGLAGGRPIWITEWGCLNESAPSADGVVAFYQGALAVFARHPRVERYAWYPWSTNCGLTSSDGSLTALGKVYAAAPAFR